jgi:hypothetical protein
MARAKLRSPGRAAAVEMEAPEAPSSAAPWWLAFSLLAFLAVWEVWLPVSRINAHFEMNYNEGWNAYLQQTVADGGRIYGSAAVYTWANYPPLSFQLVGWLGKLTHDVTRTGRWVELLSFFALIVLTGLTIERLTGSRRSALFSALTAAIFIGTLKSDRIAMNDPHLLGMALVAFGFYAYAREPESRLWLRISAVAFVIGLFTKQTLVAFPCAVAIQLFLTSRKHLRTWLASGAVATAVLLAWTFAMDGSHFLEHLAFPRVFSYDFFLSNTGKYLVFFQAAVAAALVWCFGETRADRTVVLVWAFALAHGLGMFFASGAGADLNHMFDPALSVAMIGGASLPYAVWLSERVRFRRTLLAVLLCVPFFLGSLTWLGPRLQEDQAMSRSVPLLEQDFANAVEYVKSRPGPALCESLLLCFEAGKPDEFDAFAVDQLVKTGRVRETEILRLLNERHFAVIQLGNTEPIAPDAERMRFSQAFMATLLKDYQPAMRTSAYTFFTPKP